MKHALERMMLLTASSCVLLMAACSTDTAYDDLDDVDLTIQVGSSGLTLPLGSTDRIPLTEVMDPATVDVLDTLANGDFVINKEGGFDPTRVNVDRVTVNIAPSIAPAEFGFEAVLPDGTIKTAVDAYITLNPAAQGVKLSSISGVPADAAVTLNAIKYDNVSFDDCTFAFKATNVDKALLALSSAQLATPQDLKITLAVSALPDHASAYSLQLTDVQITLPEYLQIEGQTPGRIDVGTMTLNKAAGATSASTTLTYRITGIDYTQAKSSGELAVVNQTLSDEGQIVITANASTDRSISISPDDVMIQDGRVKLVQPISIAPTVQIGDITIEQIAGRFSPTIDPISTSVDLDLGDDMDFLKDDATIDLANPIITLNMTNPCEVKVLADLTLTASNGVSPIVISDIDLTQPVITISRQGVSGAAYNVTVPTLSSLLNPIPDQIDVLITPHTDTENVYPFTLGRNYEISGQYNVSAPLDFNSLDIKYDETIEDVFGDNPDDKQDMADLLPEGMEGAVLSFTVTNAIPISLDLEVTATNERGVEDPTLVTYSNSQAIAAGTLTAPTTSNQTISVGVKDVAAVKDLIVRVHGTALAGTTLNARQYVRFDNMRLTIKKVTLDLNDDDD